MSHQTGIKPDVNLIEVIKNTRNGLIRAIKVTIVDEQLVCSEVVEAKGSWNEEYDSIVGDFIEPGVPCYILYRFDEKSSLGFFWLLLHWIPEKASTREKMLYASTKASLKSEFGSSYIKECLTLTSLDAITLYAYTIHKNELLDSVPLTSRENELKHTKVCTEVNNDTRVKTFRGLAISLTKSTIQCLQDVASNVFNYAQFKINIPEEEIEVVKSSNISIECLPNEIPINEARNLQLEIGNGSELTAEQMYDQLYPKIITERPKFSKPKGPPSRGARRVTKCQTNN